MWSAMAALVVGWLLLLCGAGGLAYGVAATAWVVWRLVAGGDAERRTTMWHDAPRRVGLLVLCLVTPAYILLYRDGYVRPGHHPPSAGVYESARVGLQAQSMAFGPAAQGLWPVTAFALIAVIAFTLFVLVRWRRDPRVVGAFLLILAGGAVAFGIGWGRSGFVGRDMGFAWRYGWITFMPVAVACCSWIAAGGRAAKWGPRFLLLAALAVTPVNVVSGFLDAEQKVRLHQQAWEADVRSGLTAEEVYAKHYPKQAPDPEVIEAMKVMRDANYTYYGHLGRERP